MSKVVIGIIVTIVAIGVIIGIVVANNNNKDETPPSSATSDTSQSANDTNTNTQTPPEPTDTTDENASTSAVTITNFSFSPSKITVKKGTTVTWTNQDDVSHTVTADSGVGPKSELLSKGQSYSYKFDSVGTFAYHCTQHPNMTGTVEVTE